MVELIRITFNQKLSWLLVVNTIKDNEMDAFDGAYEIRVCFKGLLASISNKEVQQ